MMQGLINFPEFLAAVRSLWSRSRLSDDEIRYRGWVHIQGRRADDVIAALKKHAVDEPDIASPSWKEVWRILREQTGAGSQRHNDFELLLAQVRRVAKESKHKGVDEWTPAEVYQHYIDANTRATTHGIDGQPYPDDDGRRAKAAADYRRNEAALWRNYHRDPENDLPVPSFLDE